MKRHQVSFHAALAVLCGWVFSSVSEAQVSVRLVAIDGPAGLRDSTEELAEGINRADCADAGSTVLTYDVDLADESELRVWRGRGSASCELAESRSGDSQECASVGTVSIDDDGEIAITLAALQDGDEDTGGALCDDGDREGDDLVVFFFDRSGALSTNEDVDATEFDEEAVRIDVVPPDAPDMDYDVPELSGDSAVTVRWFEPSGSNLRYALYADPELTDCDVVSERVVAGEEAPSDVSRLRSLTGFGATRSTIDPAGDLGLALGESSLVHVAAVDDAGNAGPLSEGICVTRLPTYGYCDVLAGEAEASGGGTTCPEGCASGAAPGSGGAFLFLLAMLRRRQSGRADGASGARDGLTAGRR